MATQKKTSKTKKGANSAPKKAPFDTEAFVFETPVEKIEEAMQRLFEQDEDPMAEPLTKDEIYWLGYWNYIMPAVKKAGISTAPTCAKENAVLKLIPPKKTTRKKK